MFQVIYYHHNPYTITTILEFHYIILEACNCPQTYCAEACRTYRNMVATQVQALYCS